MPRQIAWVDGSRRPLDSAAVNQAAPLAEAIAAFQRGDLDRARALAEQGEGSAGAEHLLGLISSRGGDYASGAEHFRRAADAEPGNPSHQLMLARALVDAGRAGEALAAAGLPKGRGPAELALLEARAEAAEALGEPSLAAEAWQSICSVRRDDLRSWAGLARNLFKISRFAEAEQAYRHALKLAPAEPALLHELGSLYERCNQFAELDQLLDRSLAFGIAKERLGDLWAARELRAGRIGEARELLERAQLGADPVRFHRLKARIADARGDPAEAFAAAAAMHEANDERLQWRERASQFRDELRQLARTITSDWAAALPSVGAKPGPAFLVGFPRSGTTLLDTFLMGHPRTAVIEEQGLLPAATRTLGSLAQLPERTAQELETIRDDYVTLLNGHLTEGFSGLAIDKAPLNMLFAPLIHLMFEDAPLIFAQRHPCDAVLSGFMQSFAPNLGMASFLDICDAADFYDVAMSVWTASCAALSLNTHTVVYEELVGDPKAALQPLMPFLGLDWDDRMLDYQATARARGPILNPSAGQVVEPLSDRAVGRWRSYEKQLEPVLPILLPWAQRLGYQ